MIAQVQAVDPEFLKSATLLVIGLLAGGASVATILGLFLKRRRLIEPQPLEVKAAAEYVTSADRNQILKQIEEHSGEIRQLWNCVRQDKAEAELSASKRSAGIYERIEKVRSELTTANADLQKEIRKGFQDLERSLGRVEGKIEKTE